MIISVPIKTEPLKKSCVQLKKKHLYNQSTFMKHLYNQSTFINHPYNQSTIYMSTCYIMSVSMIMDPPHESRVQCLPRRTPRTPPRHPTPGRRRSPAGWAAVPPRPPVMTASCPTPNKRLMCHSPAIPACTAACSRTGPAHWSQSVCRVSSGKETRGNNCR